MLSRSRFLSRLRSTITDKYEFSTASPVPKISKKPLGDLFFNEQAQFLMKKMTGVDYDKIFKPKVKLEKLVAPQYQFMTNDHLERTMSYYRHKAEDLLQFPPIIDVIEDSTTVLSNDPSLDGHDKHHSKLVFTDVSSDTNRLTRAIVVREPNGLLRTANQYERYRMNQIFFPEPGLDILPPKLFESENLNKLLNDKEYEYILDRACLQYEPFEKEFHRIIIATYERVNKDKAFATLQSTRHFGSLVFYLAINSKYLEILDHFLIKKKLIEAACFVHLCNLVHEKEKISDLTEETLPSLNEAALTVEKFLVDEKLQKLQVRLQSCLDYLKSELETLKGVEKAHGAEN